MFEAGKVYRFNMWQSGKDGAKIAEYAPCKVVSVEFPLVKVATRENETLIINVASLAFVSASEAE